MVVLAQTLLPVPDTSSLQNAAEAETLLRKALAYAPENRSAWRGLGFALAAQGQEDRALAAWQTAGKMPDKFIEWGKQAQLVERYDQALIWYERAGRLEPESSIPWYCRGVVLEKLGQLDGALAAYRQAVALGASASDGVNMGDEYAAVGRVLVRLGMLQDGIPYLQLALQAGIDDPEAYYESIAVLMESGSHEEAYELLEAMLSLPQLAPDTLDRRYEDLRHDVIVELSTIASRSGNLEATFYWANMAQQTMPSDIRPYGNLISILVRQGLLEAAAEECAAALGIRRDVPELDCDCAMAFAGTGQHDVAIDLLLDATALEPDNVQFHIALGDVYRELGRVDEAVAEFQAVIRVDPEHSYALNQLGELGTDN